MNASTVPAPARMPSARNDERSPRRARARGQPRKVPTSVVEERRHRIGDEEHRGEDERHQREEEERAEDGVEKDAVGARGERAATCGLGAERRRRPEHAPGDDCGSHVGIVIGRRERAVLGRRARSPRPRRTMARLSASRALTTTTGAPIAFSSARASSVRPSLARTSFCVTTTSSGSRASREARASGEARARAASRR